MSCFLMFDPSANPPSKVWRERFKPPVDLFRDNPSGQVWKADCALQALGSMARWTFRYYGHVNKGRFPNITDWGDRADYRIFVELDLQFPGLGFATLRDAADAVKHRKLDRPGRAMTLATGGLEQRGPTVVAVLDDGSEIDCLQLATRLSDFWDRWKD